MIHYCIHPSPVGELVLAASELGLCGLYFENHRHFRGMAGWQNEPGQPLLRDAASQLDAYFEGKRKEFDLPLDLQGTPFQQRVWQQLQRLRFGERSSYLLHARAIGADAAVRAVGAAIGRNPVSIIIPCHRVLRSDGALAGYAGGLERKRYLLALEAQAGAGAIGCA
jgi:methylated-DNA-[protein]-cysteine S-methyltransferase